jgi:hypothetical protein
MGGNGIPARKAAAAIYVIAAAVRLTLAFGFHKYETAHTEDVLVAISLADKGSFADPFAAPTGPTAHCAPLYPAMIAPIYRIWGATPTADRVRVGLNTLAASAEYALLPYVATTLGLGVGPGILAGLVGALIPLDQWVECTGEFEATWAALFLMLSTAFFSRFLRRPSFSSGSALRTGLWWGFGFLLAPNLLPVLAGFLALGAWRLRPGRAAVRWMCVFTATVLAVLTPWTVRNYARLGAVFFVRDNFGLELSMSNRDGAAPSAAPNLRQPWFRALHPFASVAAARELRRMGEVAYFQAMGREGWKWIRSHPGPFCRLSLARIRTYWFPEMPRFAPAYWVTPMLAALGLVLLFRENRLGAQTLGSVLVTFPSVYYLIHNHLRYRHPVDWILLLLAAVLVTKVHAAARLRLRGPGARTAPERAAG